MVKEKVKFLESEIGNNTEFEKKISIADRKVSKCRKEYQQHEVNKNQLKDEVWQLKRLVYVFMANCYKSKHKAFPLIKVLPYFCFIFFHPFMLWYFQDTLTELSPG